jgi:T5SS/PEP-CTERM-associated repeat protein
VTVGGAGLLTDATVDVAGDLAVARNTSAGLLPGTGTLTLNNDSLVSVGGTLHLGNDPDGGGTGTININSGALLQATNVIDGANGTINHSGGTLHINGGTYTGHPVPLVVSGTGSPTLRYSGNTVNNLTAAGGVGLRVGDDLGVGTFSGNLIIDSGADVVMSGASNDINIGDDAGTSGEITVTGAGSRLVANQPGDLIRVGFNGSGDLLVSDGGQVIATEIQVPASSLNGDGLLLLEASVSPIVTTNTLSVGNDVGGLGTVTINASGTINATDPGISVLVRETGLLGMFVDSTLNATGTVLIDGGEVRLDGIIHAGTLVDIDSGGLLRTMLAGGTTPLVDGPVRVRSGGVVEAINDNLTMGKSTGTELVQFESGSLVTVGSGRTLTLLDNNNIEADGRIDLQGGTITSTQSIIMDGLVPTDQLVGFGTVDANIRFDTSSGPCAPSGSGLVFSRRLFMNGAFNATGTAIRFAPTSELVDLAAGACNLNCKVTADAGSVMRPNLGNTGAFGPITMGDGTTTGAEINGILHMGTNGSVTFNDSDGVNVNTVWDMNGGILACPSGGFTVNSNGIVRGNGTIDVGVAGGDQFILLTGGIDPDDYFPATDTYHGIATFFVDGTYVQNVGAEYYCEIAGYDNEFRPLNDRINANAVSLSGTLDVSLINGYVPNLCDEFTIMTYTSRSGAWTNIIEPPGVDVGIRYEATRAVLFFNSVECDGIDFNNDGVSPDTVDINDFLSVFGGGPCSTGNCGDLDFNNDCVTPDTSDIDALLRVFGGGKC